MTHSTRMSNNSNITAQKSSCQNPTMYQTAIWIISYNTTIVVVVDGIFLSLFKCSLTPIICWQLGFSSFAKPSHSLILQVCTLQPPLSLPFFAWYFLRVGLTFALHFADFALTLQNEIIQSYQKLYASRSSSFFWQNFILKSFVRSFCMGTFF